MCIDALSKMSESDGPQSELEIIRKEFDYTSTKIAQSFSNGSAWHYRSTLFPKLIDAESTVTGKQKLMEQELNLIRQAMWTDPKDESAWVYYRSFLRGGNFSKYSSLNVVDVHRILLDSREFSTSDEHRNVYQELLLSEIKAIKELLVVLDDNDEKKCLSSS